MFERVFNGIIFLTMTLILAAQVFGRIPQKYYKTNIIEKMRTTPFPDVIIKPFPDYEDRPMRFGK